MINSHIPCLIKMISILGPAPHVHVQQWSLSHYCIYTMYIIDHSMDCTMADQAVRHNYSQPAGNSE